jgi:hypothetical protein
MLRTTRGWIGATTAAVVVVAGAAAGVQASSSGSTPSGTGSTVPAGSSSANDPHEAAAQREADRIITTFQPPPGADQAARQPDPLPSDLRDPPLRSAAQTQATATAWYSAPQSPEMVLAWVQSHPPTGSSWEGSGSGSAGPSFVSFQYPTPHSSLIISSEAGSDGRTIIRLDASVIWTPSRNPDARLGSNAPSVSVVTTNPMNPRTPLPADEATTVTSTDPAIVHKVVDLLNALQPPVPGTKHCAMDQGIRVLITMPGRATVSADPGGCGEVTVTPQGGAAQSYDGGGDLVTKVYALFGITWSRTTGLPPGTERTAASGPR